MEDIWTHHPESLNDLILESLETRNYSILRGIQCFSECTRWATSEGMESILNTIVEKSVHMKTEADYEEQKLQENEDHYRQLGTYRIMERRIVQLQEMRIPFISVKNTCLELSRSAFLQNIQFLEDSGYIEVERRHIRDEDPFEISTLRLTPRYWEGIINDIVTTGEQYTGIYPSALATMIALSSRTRTLSTLKAVVNALNRHPNGELTRAELKNEYLAHQISPRKMYNFIKRDALKVSDIRAIVADDGNHITFSREMVRANQLWLARTLELIRTRRRAAG